MSIEKKLDKLEAAAIEKRANRWLAPLDERALLAYWIGETWPAFPSERARAAAIEAERKVWEAATPADRQDFYDADQRAALEAGRSPFADMPVDRNLVDPLPRGEDEPDGMNLDDFLIPLDEWERRNGPLDR